jgi:hypothetical protein
MLNFDTPRAAMSANRDSGKRPAGVLAVSVKLWSLTDMVQVIED